MIFIDGYCILCNGLANFLIKRSSPEIMQVATLQGATAKDLLSEDDISKYDSVILWEKGKIYWKSTAALRILSLLGGIWPLIKIFYVVPPFLRNWIYDLIARNRMKWFGRRTSCRIPTESDKHFILS